jgi:hypothetical protein
MSRFREIDLSAVRLQSVTDRVTRVGVDQFGRAPVSPADLDAAARVVAGLPSILAGTTLREVVDAIVASHRAGRPVLLLAGAHVIKVGVQPFLVPLLRRGVVTHVGLHGAGAASTRSWTSNSRRFPRAGWSMSTPT